jgi:hypothetical protein
MWPEPLIELGPSPVIYTTPRDTILRRTWAIHELDWSWWTVAIFYARYVCSANGTE